MGWSIGYDDNHKRDIGYGVPAYCDHPDCNEEIDRGLSHVCGSEPYGGQYGCGLYFCKEHLHFHEDDMEWIDLCERCSEFKEPFTPKPDHPEWIEHKLTDESWEEWRNENPDFVEKHKTTKL